MARRGVLSCALGLIFLTVLPHLVAEHSTLAMRMLQGAAICMAFTSATVVNSLTAYASLQCDDTIDEDTGKAVEEHPQLAKGKALGQFRSSGQLGRAIGPLLGGSGHRHDILDPVPDMTVLPRSSACASYWTFGPSLTYAVSAVAMFALYMSMKPLASRKTASVMSS